MEKRKSRFATVQVHPLLDARTLIRNQLFYDIDIIFLQVVISYSYVSLWSAVNRYIYFSNI